MDPPSKEKKPKTNTHKNHEQTLFNLFLTQTFKYNVTKN